jgi:hypothetical protein
MTTTSLVPWSFGGDGRFHVVHHATYVDGIGCHLRLVTAPTAQAELDTKRRKTMSQTASTLLLRNLHDVFGEIDPVRRRAAIDEIFHDGAVFYDPKGGIYRGRDEIDRIAGVIKATHPDFQY